MWSFFLRFFVKLKMYLCVFLVRMCVVVLCEWCFFVGNLSLEYVLMV